MEFASNVSGLASDTLGAGFKVGGTIAKAVPTDRKCRVQITNKSKRYTLYSPRVHTESGQYLEPFPPTIEGSGDSGECIFAKTPNTARGAVGVFTYDLYDYSTQSYAGRMAVMYKVPYDQNRKDNAFAVGVVDMSTECNKQLFQEMSKTTNPPFTREKAKVGCLTHKSDTVTVRATMSDCYTPAIKIEVSDQ